jgi:hypothetical protein
MADDETPSETNTPIPMPCEWHAHRCSADLTASEVCTMGFEGDTQLGTEWSPFPCQADEVCDSTSGYCVLRPADPVEPEVTVEPDPVEPETGPVVPETTEPEIVTDDPWPTDAQHTVRCRESSRGLEVQVTGPVLDALMVSPTTPIALQYGSDADGWFVPYQSGNNQAAWQGEGVACVVTLPSTATRFNLYVEDAADSSRDSWFDLNARADGSFLWQVVGDCRLGTREILRSTATVEETTPLIEATPEVETTPDVVTTPEEVPTSETAPETTPEIASEPEPEMPDTVVPEGDADPPHTIRCTASVDGLLVTVTGPVMDGGLMANPPSPSAIMWGSDTVGGWTVPYAASEGSGRTQTPWLADDHAHELLMPLGVDRFNLYLSDASASGLDSWFRLKASDGSPWIVTGDCQMGDGVILRR